MMHDRPRPARSSNNRIFKAVHDRNLIYNTCWEDPALDRVALTSSRATGWWSSPAPAATPWTTCWPAPARSTPWTSTRIQNALLELKRAAILGLDHASFFELFGKGRTPQARQMYGDALRHAPVAAAPGVLGQAHPLLPRQGLAEVVLLPRHVGPAGEAGADQRPRAAPAARADPGAAGRRRRSRSSGRSTRAHQARASGRRGCGGSCRAASR